MLEVEVFGAERPPPAPALAEVRAPVRGCGREPPACATDTSRSSSSTRSASPSSTARTAGKPEADRRAVVPDRRRRAGAPALRELGDVVICPAHTADLREAIVHGMLHLLGHGPRDRRRRDARAAAKPAAFRGLAGAEHEKREPQRLRRARWAPERRQVDARQRHRRQRRSRSSPTGRRPRRRAIRGVRTRAATRQIVLVDLPGVQRPRDTLTDAHGRARVSQELEGSDAALLMLNAEQGVGPGDRFIARTLASAEIPVMIAVNKIDRVPRAALLAALAAAAELDVGEDVFPISARTGSGVQALVDHLGTPDARGPVPVRSRCEQRPAARAAARRARARGRRSGAPSRSFRMPSRS